MTDAGQVTQLGVSGVIVVILLYIVKELWSDNRALRKQNHDDLSAVVPVLTAVSGQLTEFIRIATRLLERSAPKRQGDDW